MFIIGIIIISIVLIAGIAYFVIKLPEDKNLNQDHLKKMVHFFEGQFEATPGEGNSQSIKFKYRGYDCIYEEVELPGLSKNATIVVAHLKVKAQSLLNVSFTERNRTQIRSSAQSLDDVVHSRWGTTRGQVELPKSLQDFHVYTNDIDMATKLINDPKVLKVFDRYHNRDRRGHPLMSLNIVDGLVILDFHAAGGLKPSILEIQHNVTAAEAYLRELIGVAEILQKLSSEKSS